jgi:hypothetical protein
MRDFQAVWLVSALAVAWTGSCSAGNDSSHGPVISAGQGGGAGATDASTGGDGGAALGGSAGTPASGGGAAGVAGSGGQVIIDATPGDGALTEAGACAGDLFPGKLAPLDICILLDATASMQGAQGTPVVWPAVTAALIQFVSDPKSTGIGVGLIYLPVPPPPGTVIPGKCVTAADCGLYGPCVPGFKVCNGSFAKSVSCDPADYSTPILGIAELPGAKDPLVNEINGKSADGDATPTEPALRGALQYAHQWALDHPSHLTNVLFATDGLPNDCTTNTVAGAATAAEDAFKAIPSVSTFVLGIGDLNDLNTIAQKGGTTEAFIADGTNVAQKMVDLFNQIRAKGACQFQIPQPKFGDLDYDKVNVSYVPLGQTDPVSIYHVSDSAACDPVKGGWYYDVDPSDGGTPGKILLCPASCDEVKLSDQGVSVLLGCKTLVF